MRLGKRTAAAVVGLAGALILGAMSVDARAQQLVNEVKLGVLAHDVPDLWSGFQREDRWADINAEVIFAPSLPLFGGTLSPALGASINTNGDTSRAYLDARWQLELPSSLFLGIGIGAAIHDGELDPIDAGRKALGSRVLFHVPLEIGLRLDERNSISIYYEHYSNGELARYNEGMDSLGVRYGRKL
ncbi:MAG: hypothetical protein RLZ98_2520 [Pseudomonadota bacterium]|jgi:hypothetical protein